MFRFATNELENWLRKKNRKPIVLRGARQVGKTWIVRDLAKRQNLDLIEINFERSPILADLFSVNDPQEVLKNIEAELAITIQPDKSILFLDEIQVAPQLFSKLRWFKEEFPDLPVVAAGSLVEYALNNQNYSMPVGRISYYYLEPMSFFEFVKANENKAAFEKLRSFNLKDSLPESLHQKYLGLYQEYCLVGGMPEVVTEWVEGKDLKSCIKIQQDLLATYRDDFHKYGGKIDANLLSKLMLSIAEQLGNKFVYGRVDPFLKVPQNKQAIDLLAQARVCSKVYHTSSNGLPLGAESNEKFFKMILLDIGLVSAQLGLSLMQQSEAKNLLFTNKGGLAEQFIGQQLRTLQTPVTDSPLYYWLRIGGRQGEIDYIIQHENRIIPVEVKAGSSGSMKSLHQFMADKKLDLAVRFYTGTPAFERLDLKSTLGHAVSYQLLSIPHYLIENLPKMIDECTQ